MVDFEAPNFFDNSNILIDGMNYADLPDFVDWGKIKSKMKEVLENIEMERYEFYEYDADQFVKGFKAVNSPLGTSLLF